MPAVRDVYDVLTAFTAGMTVEDVCSRLNPRLLGIDERHVSTNVDVLASILL